MPLIAITTDNYVPAPPPTLVSVTPSLVNRHGLIAIEIKGFNLSGTNSVTVGGTACTAIENIDSDTVYCLTPAKAAGVYDLRLDTGGGFDTLTNGIKLWYFDQLPGTPEIHDSELGVTGSPVSAWADQGSGGNNFAQATVGLRPAYVDKRFSDGKRHALIFDPIAQTAMSLSAAVTFVARSVFAVVKYTGVPPGQTSEIESGTAGGVVDFALDATGGATTMRVYGANSATNFRSPNDFTLSDGSPTIVGCTLANPSRDLKFFKNDVQQGPTQTFEVFGSANWKTVGNGGGNVTGYEMGFWISAAVEYTGTDLDNLIQCAYGTWVARSTNFTTLNNSTLPWFARDGAPLLGPASAPYVYIVGGWNGESGGPFDPINPRVTNEIWRAPVSDMANGWVLIRANDPTYPPVDGPPPQHTAGSCLHIQDGVEYIYQCGSDAFNNETTPAPAGNGFGNSNVWRAAVQLDGSLGIWQHVTSTAPWGPILLHMVASFNGALLVMGGQTDVGDNSTVSQKVYRSFDGGFTWSRLADAPWAGRGMIYDPAILHNKLYIACGGGYNPPRVSSCYNDVWSLDTNWNWTEELANGLAPFQVRCYLMLLSFDNQLWLMNGATDPNVGDANGLGNIGDCWRSPTPNIASSWVKQTITPWRNSHADGMCALTDRIASKGGNGEVGEPSDPGVAAVYQITRNGFAI